MALLDAEHRRRESSGAETAHRDWLRALEATAPVAAQPKRLLFHVIEGLARTSPDAPALISADESFTYAQLAARANMYARWAIAQNLAKGDIVCLIMPNRPEYLAIWLGLTSVGVVVALINTQLRGASLVHCIDIVAPQHMIVAAEYAASFRDAAAQLMSDPKIWTHGDDSAGECERIDCAVERF